MKTFEYTISEKRNVQSEICANVFPNAAINLWRIPGRFPKSSDAKSILSVNVIFIDDIIHKYFRLIFWC